MKHFLRSIFFISLSSYVIGTLLAPVNVYVKSKNFSHVLHWSPGPGTPPGTTYKIYFRNDNGKFVLKHETILTSQSLTLNPKQKYAIRVQASHNGSVSALVNTSFSPYAETVVDSPTISLVGCGNCLGLNITLDESVKKVFQTLISFDVFWKRAGETKAKKIEERNYSFKLDDLKVGVEYCVNVHMKISINHNTRPSGWQCAYTSVLEPDRVPGFVAVAAVLFIVGGVGVMFFTSGLIYTGFLCKPKIPLLIAQDAMVPSHYYFTPERITTNRITILSATVEREKAHRPNTNHNRENPNLMANGEEEEEEEEEEGGICGYMDHATGLSSDGSSNTTLSQCEPGAGKLVHSGGFSFKVAVEEEEEAPELFGGLARGEAKGENSVVISSLDNDEQDKEEEEEETSGNINLFSVTLGAFKKNNEEEEEEDEEESDTAIIFDFSKQEQKPLLSIDPLQGSSQLGSKGSLRDFLKSTDLGLIPPKMDSTETHSGYTDRHADRTTETQSGYTDRHADRTTETQSGYTDRHADRTTETQSGYTDRHADRTTETQSGYTDRHADRTTETQSGYTDRHADRTTETHSGYTDRHADSSTQTHSKFTDSST